MIKTTVAVLREAVRAVSLVIEARNTIPVLGNFLLQGSAEGDVSLSGTNMDHVARVRVSPAECSEATATTIRAKPLLAMLKLALPDEAVTITPEKLQTRFVIGDLDLTLSAFDTKDFPVWNAAGEEGSEFSIEAGEFRRIVGAVAYCSSTEETRYYLNGVYLHPTNDDLAAAATDGHRIMLAKTPKPKKVGDWKGGILPNRMVGILRDFLGRLPADQKVTVNAGPTKIRVSHGNAWSIASSMIDGIFPDYDRVIPAKKNDAAHLVIHDPKGFARAIHQIRSIAHGKSAPVEFGGDVNKVIIMVRDAGEGQARVTLPDSVCQWQDIKTVTEFGFQARYLIATAAAFPAGFTMQILSQNAPCRMEGKEGLAVLMPMRV